MKQPPYTKIYTKAPAAPYADIPQAVRDSIKANWSDPGAAFDALQYDGLNGCYCIGWAGMYVGIEKDGHTHT